MKTKEYYDASLIYKAILIHGEENNQPQIELVDTYMRLGECLLNDALSNGDLVGKDEERQENLEIIYQHVDKDGNFNRQGFE